ncbi:hypothetical protein MJO28_005509 [Puccinia striiformis f. sp. tritici]|uniref:Uncharacterized protein n=1 Tax=Puccinia striiformis f. sp. tritici TaxID=168172 RepID=A0ACC0EKW7_9BASI|nr:hypothetical protein MJO28_005509 [Puccinia striiformis f. sp. tritici]
MVHVFQTTSLFAVLLVMALAPGLFVASAIATSPPPYNKNPREGEGGSGGQHNTRAIAFDSRPTVVTPGNNGRDGKIVRRAITLDAHPHPVPAGEGTPRKTAHGV